MILFEAKCKKERRKTNFSNGFWEQESDMRVALRSTMQWQTKSLVRHWNGLFQDYQESTIYGLRTSSEHWYLHFPASLSGIGFTLTQYDKDVWIQLNEDGDCYDYICKHVDDFMIVGKDPKAIMDMIQAIYAVKSIDGPPNYNLGNDYKKDRES